MHHPLLSDFHSFFHSFFFSLILSFFYSFFLSFIFCLLRFFLSLLHSFLLTSLLSFFLPQLNLIFDNSLCAKICEFIWDQEISNYLQFSQINHITVESFEGVKRGETLFQFQLISFLVNFSTSYLILSHELIFTFFIATIGSRRRRQKMHIYPNNPRTCSQHHCC